MSKPPAFQLYASDFLVGTAMMTAEEVGAYIRLLCYQWEHGPLPNDPEQIARLAGCGGNAVASIWHKFGICQNGGLLNAKLEEVRKAQEEFRAKQSQNAKKGWKNRKTSRPGNGLAMPPHQSGICQNDALQSSSSYNTSSKEDVCADESAPAATDEKSEVKKASKPKPPKQTPEQFIESLRTNPAYAHIDVAVELARMDAWLSVNPGRQKTPRFVVAWLNRIQAPIKPQDAQAPKTAPTPTQIQNGIKTGGW